MVDLRTAEPIKENMVVRDAMPARPQKVQDAMPVHSQKLNGVPTSLRTMEKYDGSYQFMYGGTIQEKYAVSTTAANFLDCPAWSMPAWLI